MICHNFSSFVEEIMNLSQAQNWEAAKQEWEFESVFRNQSTCLCGHPIIENCVIHNKYNNNTAIVGNHCVLKFMGVDSAKYHFGLKKILVDSYKSINKELLEFIHDKKVITYNEYRFLANTLKKRNLTQKQKDYRFNLNQKIIAFMKSKSCSHS